MDINKHVGEMVRIKRSAKGLSQAEVADALGLNRTSIVNIEAGRQGISMENLWRLCALFTCTPNEFLPAPPTFTKRQVVTIREVKSKTTKYQWNQD